MKYRETTVYKKKPKGWKVLEGTLTQPVGTVWISNGEPIFKKGKDGKPHKNPKRKTALCVENEALMITRIAEQRNYKDKNAADFVADAKTEKKIKAEMNRQRRARLAWEREREKRARAAGKNQAKKKGGKK